MARTNGMRCNVCDMDIHWDKDAIYCDGCERPICNPKSYGDYCIGMQKKKLILCKKCVKGNKPTVNDKKKLMDWMITKLGYSSKADMIENGYGKDFPRRIIAGKYTSILYNKLAGYYQVVGILKGEDYDEDVYASNSEVDEIIDDNDTFEGDASDSEFIDAVNDIKK